MSHIDTPDNRAAALGAAFVLANGGRLPKRPKPVILCPTCKVSRLSRAEAAKGYQCALCTRRDEGCGY